MKIALIPARGGSKRIPRKNIRLFAGKPAIAYAIYAAKKSGLFDRIIVSTDDDEIAQVAEQWGAEAPFRRPADIADDHATTLDVLAHAVKWAENEGTELDALCCIYPINPLLRHEDISAAYTLFKETAAGYCFPVTEFPSPIQRAVKKREDGRLQMFNPEDFTTRSQDLEPAYHDAGQFYWGKPDLFKMKVAPFSEEAVPYLIPAWRVVDVDTLEDWQRAELIYQALQEQDKIKTA